MLQTGAGWLLVLALLVGLIWAVRRGRKGYTNVMALMAQVEAHASADARAAAVASNAVHLHGLGGGARGADYYDLDRGADYDHHGAAAHHNHRGHNDHHLLDIDYDHLAAAVARQLAGSLGIERGPEDGTRVLDGARRVVPGDALRDQGGAVT